MLGVGAAANGLVGASANPFDAAASDLAENSSDVGNGSTQLSVEDLAAGSHDPAVQGTETQVAAAVKSSASLPLPPQTTSSTTVPGYQSLPVPAQPARSPRHGECPALP